MQHNQMCVSKKKDFLSWSPRLVTSRQNILHSSYQKRAQHKPNSPELDTNTCVYYMQNQLWKQNTKKCSCLSKIGSFDQSNLRADSVQYNWIKPLVVIVFNTVYNSLGLMIRARKSWGRPWVEWAPARCRCSAGSAQASRARQCTGDQETARTGTDSCGTASASLWTPPSDHMSWKNARILFLGLRKSVQTLLSMK